MAVDEVLSDLLARSHRVSARGLASLIDEGGQRLGLSGAWLFVTDLQQVRLVALPRTPAASEQAVVAIDGSLGGLAYRTQRIQRSRDGGTAWVPMIDGLERVGVLKVTSPALSPDLLESSKALAALATLLVVAKSSYSDLLAGLERSQAMTIQGELVWAFLPPRTIGTPHVTSTAVLEPAYDAGGDAFDHNLTDGTLHLTLLDAMGHDLASGGASAAGLAACRSTRRDGGTLSDIAGTIDHTLSQWFPGRFMTAIIATLDTHSGRLTWINCGHAPPLLLRDGHVLPHALERTPQLPLGLGLHTEGPLTEHQARLQPGDHIVLYSDGVTEARTPAGDLFGEQRLTDAITRSMATENNAPETLRRLIHSLHQEHDLRDDATILLTQWHPT